jgi:hypothetical protein
LGDLANRDQRNAEHRSLASVASPFRGIQVERQI